MYFFGIAALDRFKTKLKDYPQYCQVTFQGLFPINLFFILGPFFSCSRKYSLFFDQTGSAFKLLSMRTDNSRMCFFVLRNIFI